MRCFFQESCSVFVQGNKDIIYVYLLHLVFLFFPAKLLSSIPPAVIHPWPLPPLSLSCNHGTNRIPLISSSGIQSIAPTQYLRPFGHNITSARTFSCLFIIFCNCCTFSDYKNSRQCERKQLIVKKFTNLRFIQPDRVGRQQITPQKINFL